MKALKYILIFGLALLIALGGYLAWQVLMPLDSQQIVLRVESGDNARTIAQRLAQNKIIRSRELFLLLAKWRGTDRKLQAGAYSFGGHYNLNQTLRLLEDGNTEAIRITIPPGFSMFQVLRRIERSGLASYDSLYARATDPAFVNQLTGFALPSLEGWLFPDTYSYDIATPVDTLLALPVRNFLRKAKVAGLDPQATPDFQSKLTLASIVEKESAHPDERVIIAGVYLNRLRKGMRLESCPTVDYILERRGISRTVLLNSDLAIENPYNTYRNDGLPPGPICNPSLESLQAVINPQPNNFLFFVSNRKGRNDFSATYQEHLSKKRKYERGG